MSSNKYDIFISYRSEDGAQYARILQMMLEKTGYRVFLDYDELKSNRFGEDITQAIQSAPIFLMVLTPLYLKRCKEEGNWIKREIDIAINCQRHFVPLNPDHKFTGVPAGLPPEIEDIVVNYQHSIIDFGQTLKATYGQMIENQIKPIIKPRKKSWARWSLMAALCLTTICLGIFAFSRCPTNDSKIQQVRLELERKYAHLGIYLSPDLSARQLEAINDILKKMVPVKKDSLLMSQFEFTVAQWNGLLDKDSELERKDMPMTNVSYGEIYLLIGDLSDMTNINFDLPSVEEWEYAAYGGNNAELTRYAGDDNPDKVAWFADNSNGHAHPCDGQQGKNPNSLDLYDMSGNVGELCNTPFDDNGLYTICGGNYDSPSIEVMVSSRVGIATDAKDKAVGFRLIIRKI